MGGLGFTANFDYARVYTLDDYASRFKEKASMRHPESNLSSA